MESFFKDLISALPDAVRPIRDTDSPVFIDELDPVAFWSHFTGAYAADRPVVIFDPAWPDNWKNSFSRLCGTMLPRDGFEVLIPTSGTSGRPKFCVHTEQTLLFAARSFAQRFAANGYIHSVSVLPQHHIGGLMASIRSAVMRGKVSFADYREEIGSALNLKQASISLVPTQLRRLLKSETSTEQLRRYGIIFVGGAACPMPLLEKARNAGLSLAPCYGSTETAAMVTVLEPEAFKMGRNTVGIPLPGVHVKIAPDGRITVESESLLTGYLPMPAEFNRMPFATSDLGEIDSSGELRIIGRSDRVIISGGKKVVPENIESICMQTELVEDAWCYGVHDPDWGMQVQLDFVPKSNGETVLDQLRDRLRKHLPSYAVPKQLNLVKSISRNPMGKKSL